MSEVMQGETGLLFLDLETTGLRPEHGAVPLEICFLYERTENSTEPITLSVTICPTEDQWAKASPQALVVNGFTWERLQQEGIPMEEARDQICSWMMENDISRETAVVVGQNIRFDLMFLAHYMGPELTSMGFPLVKDYYDTMEMAKELASKDKSVRFISFKGSDIALTLGVEPEPALHTALGGVMAARRNYYELSKRLSKFKN